jgi:MFS superfamily sulfate permease-like transporter
VIADLSNVPYTDVSGARMLARLHDELAPRGISFKVVEAHGPVRVMLRNEQLEQRVGTISRLESLHDLLGATRTSSAVPPSGE